MRLSRFKTSLAALSLTVLVVAGQSVALTTQVHAANPDNFKAGNIISDYVFTDNNSMSAGEIQNFLEAKNSVCLKNFRALSLHDADNNGLGDEPYGKGQGNKVRASTLIWQAAQIYDISPKVILVTLQKEQGLITRDDCPQWRYRTALGYGCPDSEPCDDSAYGFTRQIDYGTWHFRGFFDDSLTYVPYTPGKHSIAYNPSSSCGSSVVDIQNRATAALYSYTPYQPNKASLNAGYGTGNSCSSYGNRNFWLYFTDWFGSTIGTPFFRVKGSVKIYIRGEENTYYYVPTPQVLDDYGFGKQFKKISTINQDDFSSMQSMGNLGSIARFEGDAIYVVDARKLHRFPSSEMFADYGYSFGDEAKLPEWISNYLRRSGGVKNVLKQNDKDAIFYVKDGRARPFCSWEAYAQLGSPVYSSQASVTVDSYFADTLTSGAPIMTAGSLLKAADTGIYWIWDGLTLQKINKTIARNTGLPTCNAKLSTASQLPSAETTTLNNLAKDSTNKLYILDNKKKISVPTDQLTELGLTAASFQPTSEAFLDRLPTKQMSTLVRINGGDGVFLIKAGERMWVSSADDLHGLGYDFGQVINIDKPTSQLFPVGGMALKPGRLIRINDKDAVYLIDDSFKKLKIPSGEMFLNFGFKWKNVRSVSSEAAQKYSDAGPLSQVVRDSADDYWIISSGSKHKISDSLQSGSYYDLSQGDASLLSSKVIKGIENGKNLTNLIRAKGRDAVYQVENGQKRVFTSRQSFASTGRPWDDIIALPKKFVDTIPDGQPIK